MGGFYKFHIFKLVDNMSESYFSAFHRTHLYFVQDQSCFASMLGVEEIRADDLAAFGVRHRGSYCCRRGVGNIGCCLVLGEKPTMVQPSVLPNRSPAVVSDCL